MRRAFVGLWFLAVMGLYFKYFIYAKTMVWLGHLR